MKAIAAMSRNRVIGCGGGVPWHLPEELRWFKRATLGGVVLMGRRTYESIGRPLPGRLNLVASRGRIDLPAGVEAVGDLDNFRPADYAPREVWVIGGAEIYARLLPACTELYLSVLAREVAGDTFFPSFETDFVFRKIVLQHEEFETRLYTKA